MSRRPTDPATSRRATIRTRNDDPELVARALRPDNTDEMETDVEHSGATGRSESGTERAGRVVTRIERESTAGLQSTVDDYVVNLAVAIDVAHGGRDEQCGKPTDAGEVSDNESEYDTIHDE
ncbi:KEOPS complex Pcc1-like subunit [Natrarchaeobius halalkaliphilus]|uniref:KEOPS complex Pcc1-like subunit n=1 Tax=Natrarchaeobius halalkaliphilus TaxID=1679091 RepID=A0A3N6P461_9EURY|nr:KEOPS complex subunit Pcc1 [Natrarchaeobius halalkaliphilus]RQG90135.1 KEOPS complex Pcc1-like subunit [Natrarchaeobius halalkaliphilus]